MYVLRALDFAFYEDGTKSKEGSPCPSQNKAKAKALKAKKAVVNGVPSHTQKEDPHVTHLPKV